MAEAFVRYAEAADVDELARLRWQFGEEDPEDNPKDGTFEEFRDRFWDFFEAALESGRWTIWVADTGDRLVGTLWVEKVDRVPRQRQRQDAWGYITNVYVEPSYRDFGIGSRLLRTAIKAARLEKLEVLIVWPSDESADFYRSEGFEPNPMLFELSITAPQSGRRIYVVDYDPRWPEMFEEEKRRIWEAIGDAIEAVEHVGSTAVPGCGAKPTIDIMVGLKELSDYKQCVLPLQEIGYEFAPWADVDLSDRRYFRKVSEGRRTHHLHMCEVGGRFWERHIAFRDYLQAHPEDAARYYELKKKLAAELEYDSIGYTEAKTEFIEGILSEAEAGT